MKNAFILIENPTKDRYDASLVIDGKTLCSIEYIAPKDDKEPGGSAVSLLWHKFKQDVGQDIRQNY